MYVMEWQEDGISYRLLRIMTFRADYHCQSVLMNLMDSLNGANYESLLENFTS